MSCRKNLKRRLKSSPSSSAPTTCRKISSCEKRNRCVVKGTLSSAEASFPNWPTIFAAEPSLTSKWKPVESRRTHRPRERRSSNWHYGHGQARQNEKKAVYKDGNKGSRGFFHHIRRLFSMNRHWWHIRTHSSSFSCKASTRSCHLRPEGF